MRDQFIAWGQILGGILLILLRNRFGFGGDEFVSRNPPKPTRGAALLATVAGIGFVVWGVLILMGKLK